MDCGISTIFKNKVFIKDKLKKFSFKSIDNQLFYSVKIVNGQFQLDIIIEDLKTVKTKLLDLNSNQDYVLHLVDGITGEFVGNVRKEYYEVLKNIADNCCITMKFASCQANRLTEYIKEKYNNDPEFLWEKFPDYGVFRNSLTKKWYALISNVSYSKINKNKTGEIELLNIKLNKDKIEELLKIKGFYPAYHMNKKNWISVILDESIEDDKIKVLLEESYRLSSKNK